MDCAVRPVLCGPHLQPPDEGVKLVVAELRGQGRQPRRVHARGQLRLVEDRRGEVPGGHNACQRGGQRGEQEVGVACAREGSDCQGRGALWPS
jgi:hypothetical protein